MFTIHGPGWSRPGIKFLALDLDDTLLDHSSAAASAAHLVSASWQLGHDDAAAVWTAAMNTHFPKYELGECSWEDQRRLRIREFVTASLTDHEADTLFEQYLAHYEAGWSAYPEAERLRARVLLAGIPVAVLTNGNLHQQQRKLRAIGWDSAGELFASSAVGAAKPESEYFTTVARDSSVLPSEIFMLGDNAVNDFGGAQKAGCHSAHLDRGDTGIREPRIVSLDQLEVRDHGDGL